MKHNALAIPIIELIYNFAVRKRATIGSME
jgi:hypothetical protein